MGFTLTVSDFLFQSEFLGFTNYWLMLNLHLFEDLFFCIRF